MCGITGIIKRGLLNEEDHLRVSQMNAAIKHRGPDEQGQLVADHFMLAMRRLSIIDLQSGQQPIFNEDKTIAVIANGEIYNYVELMESLVKRGHVFRSKSDIETIVHLYEAYGAECIEQLRGMFAFALWDARNNQLLLVRDRIGEKPLYLYEADGGEVRFASELKSLLKSLPSLPPLDPFHLDLYLHYQYVPEPFTPFKNIRKLPAGHYMLIQLDPWSLTELAYWSPSNAPGIADDPAATIRQELETISQIIIRSDVPVGISLSGGLDSGALALLSAPKYPDIMQAFTAGYPGRKNYDERTQAQHLAEKLGMPFHEIEIETSAVIASFPHLVSSCDDPIADIAAFPQYSIMQMAASHGIKVMLNGIGGDELFWGYDWLRKAARQTAEYVYPRDNPAAPLVFYNLTPGFIEAEKWRPRLYQPDMHNTVPLNNAYLPFTVQNPWENVNEKISKALYSTWLLSNSINLGDRLSMANSVELRTPLVDYRLIEIIWGLRRHHDDLNLPHKQWLKSALQDIIPTELVNRPKQGFTPPVIQWVYELSKKYQEILEEGVLTHQGFLKKAPLVSMTRRFIRRGDFYNRSLFSKLPGTRYRNRVMGKILPPDANMDILYKLLVFQVWHAEMEKAV